MSDFKEVADEILIKVVERLDAGQKKYGDEYFLSDVAFEFDAEVHDIIGWMMLHAIRLKMVSMGVVKELNEKYLDIFVKKTRTEYLEQLNDAIHDELTQRKRDEYMKTRKTSENE